MPRPLPARPSLEQLKKQAKTFLKGHQASSPDAIKQIAEHHPRWRNASEAAIKNARLTLSDAQLVVANQYGFETWPKLKAHVELHESSVSTDAAVKLLREAASRGDIERLAVLLDAKARLD